METTTTPKTFFEVILYLLRRKLMFGEFKVLELEEEDNDRYGHGKFLHTAVYNDVGPCVTIYEFTFKPGDRYMYVSIFECIKGKAFIYDSPEDMTRFYSDL